MNGQTPFVSIVYLRFVSLLQDSEIKCIIFVVADVKLCMCCKTGTRMHQIILVKHAYTVLLFFLGLCIKEPIAIEGQKHSTKVSTTPVISKYEES